MCCFKCYMCSVTPCACVCMSWNKKKAAWRTGKHYKTRSGEAVGVGASGLGLDWAIGCHSHIPQCHTGTRASKC
jgi:hypothetical protein